MTMHTTQRAKYTPRWLAVLTVIAMTILGLAAPASAAEINNAVTDVRVTTTDATIFSDVTFEVDWTVPNGSSGGDFFSLDLPDALDAPDTLTFDLADPAGQVIAIATVSNGVITFTLTDAVNGQNNISGTAFITTGLNQDVVQDGAAQDITFVTAAGTFTQELVLQEFVPNPDALKFVRLLDAPNANGNQVISGIETRLLTADDLGATVTIIDTPAPGIELDCAATSVSIREFPSGDTLSTVPPADVTETCTPTSSTVSFEVTPDMVDTKVRATFELAITNPAQTEFSNDGSIDIAGDVTLVDAADAFLEAGGQADADTFDLALIKQLEDGTNLATVAPGDSVTFTITVENQGAVDAANIELVDFVSDGLTLNDDAWTDNGDGTASLSTPIAALAAGESTSVNITFTVDADATGTIDNFAEISNATDANGNPVNDIDSTPDAINDDVFLNDDDTTGNGLAGEDEDDSDRAQLTIEVPAEPAPEPDPEPEPEPQPEPEPEPAVFDLALIKQLSNGTNLATVESGDAVTFTLTVENQGEVDAANIALTDFIPNGLTLNDLSWTDNGNGTATLNTPIAALAAGASTTVNITFTVDDNVSGTISNFAEISDATDADGNAVTDIDSTPDAISDNDNFVTDDDTTGNGLAGGDEDDHDRAQLNVQIPVEVQQNTETTPQLAVTGTDEEVLAWAISVSLLLLLFGTMITEATTGFRRSDSK